MERKLRLVPPAAEHDDEAPPSAEELAEAEALRAALDHLGAASGPKPQAGRAGLDRSDAPLAADLRAAFAPDALDGGDLDAILARALGDESATTRIERDAAERLRAELEGEKPWSDEAAVLHQLRVAVAPKALDPAKNEALVEAAIARTATPPRVDRLHDRRAGRRIAPVTMAALASVTALAAGFALLVGQMRLAPRGVDPSATLIRARSTQDLFDAATPFPRSGEESARIDRIAAARASDLRKNRFAAWGVR
ncbi:Hypothetical protein A7982_00430 [Minicystis rosea]|nr:Hypothetical protein A7982_00430 [Minicystis rosea]